MNAHELIEKYPKTAGYKRDGTSKEAANSTDEKTLRGQVLRILGIYSSGLTADEAAESLGESILSIRPRLSELVALGEIEDSGIRRRNESGKMATVWRLV